MASSPTAKQRVGIVGVPPHAVMAMLADPDFEIFDLDEPQGKIDIETASPFLPRVYCGILRTVIANSLAVRPASIYIDTGAGKCDCAVHTAIVLEDILPECTIIRTRNADTQDFGTPLCRTSMPLAQKMATITASVQNPDAYQTLPACLPTAGFWGVPPRDFTLLNYFPDTTHIYGWARCMENKTPDNMALEIHFNADIPTVFFAQSFCAKTALARHLASKHPHGLYLDCDVTAGNSVKAKIQAFLELSGITTP
jgi:hypothetical protein